MHMSKNLGFAAAILLLSISVGCSTRLDRHWGESQRALIAIQIANPDPKVAEPTFDGVGAEAAIETHRSADGSIGTQPLLDLDMVGGGY